MPAFVPTTHRLLLLCEIALNAVLQCRCRVCVDEAQHIQPSKTGGVHHSLVCVVRVEK